MTPSRTLAAGALLTGLAVALGAFGAHGLEARLEASQSVDTWETAVRYQAWHGLALIALGLLRERRAGGADAAWAFLIGTLAFSTSLYALSLELGPTSLWGPVTPLGGLSLLIGWALFLRCSLREPRAVTALATCLLVGLTSGCGSMDEIDEGERIQHVENGELADMTNVCFYGQLWVGGQPSAEALELAARRGVELVIDLSREGELEFDASAVCQREGLEYQAVPCFGLGEDEQGIDEFALDAVLELLDEHAGRPTLMFSRSGSEAALVFALHRGSSAGLSIEEAVAEARRAGLKPGVSEDELREQLQRLLTRA